MCNRSSYVFAPSDLCQLVKCEMVSRSLELWFDGKCWVQPTGQPRHPDRRAYLHTPGGPRLQKMLRSGRRTCNIISLTSCQSPGTTVHTYMSLLEEYRAITFAHSIMLPLYLVWDLRACAESPWITCNYRLPLYMVCHESSRPESCTYGFASSEELDKVKGLSTRKEMVGYTFWHGLIPDSQFTEWLYCKTLNK